MRVRTVVVTPLVAWLALMTSAVTGCGAGRDGDGTVHGTVTSTGGPSGAPAEATAGTVTATGGGHRIARQTVAAGQEFSFRLVAGTYRLSVSDAGPSCADETVTVAAGTDQSVSLICPRK
jgi:hypothetical protein